MLSFCRPISYKSIRKRKFAIECLENRRLFAGDVAVSVQADGILVQGDHRSNQIEITESRYNYLTISGLSGTKINGLASITVALPRRDALTVRLGGGNDELIVRDATLENISVLGQGGADKIFIERVNTRKDIDIRGGTGNDSIIVDSVIAERINLKGNKNDDFIAVYANDSQTRCRTLNISGGKGAVDRGRIVGDIFAEYIHFDTE